MPEIDLKNKIYVKADKKVAWEDIPKGIETIGSYAFANTLVGKVFVPSSLKKVAKSAFENCPDLYQCDLPIGIEIIEDDAFNGCKSLEIIDCVSGSGYEQNFLSDIKSVGRNAFTNCKKFTTVDYGVSDSIVPWGCFLGCTNLTEVNISSPTVEYINSNAFYDCKKLKTVKLPAVLKTISVNAFYNCCKLDHIDLPKTVTILYPGAFMNCTSLKYFNIDDIDNASLRLIGANTFSNCTQLKTFVVPENVQVIGEGAFNGCSNLEQVIFKSDMQLALLENADKIFTNCLKLTRLEFPSCILVKDGLLKKWRKADN